MSTLDLRIERAVPGGRMLARHDGVIVLVSGTIPGELVRVRIERRTRQLIWAETVSVIEPSASRRPPLSDSACGGLDYAHIEYATQLQCKGAVIVDAFRRIGKMTIDEPVPVEPSPERAYRLRARLHVQRGRAGFLREGTHVLCDAAATAQMLPETMAAVDAAMACLGPSVEAIGEILVAENVAATERVLHFDLTDAAGTRLRRRDFRETATRALAVGGLALTGATMVGEDGVRTLVGSARVTDTAADLFDGDESVPAGTCWTRQAPSFFQGNRFLAGPLARHVLSCASGGRIADLYAGVGLFAVALASRGSYVTAVEGDPMSATDLALNAGPWADRMDVRAAAVEEVVPTLHDRRFDAVVVDPPRTGLSPAAIEAVIALKAPRLVYVSCDPATLARDGARAVSAGYRLASLQAFDLFPNTAHVECVAMFTRETA